MPQGYKFLEAPPSDTDTNLKQPRTRKTTWSPIGIVLFFIAIFFLVTVICGATNMSIGGYTPALIFVVSLIIVNWWVHRKR